MNEVNQEVVEGSDIPEFLRREEAEVKEAANKEGEQEARTE